MNYTPRLNIVAIIPDPKVEQTAGGIFIPKPKTNNRTGTVKAVGEKVEAPLNEGDRVTYFENNVVTEGELQYVPEENVLAILNAEL